MVRCVARYVARGLRRRNEAQVKELDRAAIDAEECVLGAVLLRPTAYDVVVAAGLTADDFLDLRDRAVWTALGALVEHGQPIDITTLCDALDRMGLGRSEERRVGKECRSRWSP